MSTSLAHAPHGLALKSGSRAFSPLQQGVSQRLTLHSRTWTAGIFPAPAVRRSVSGWALPRRQRDGVRLSRAAGSLERVNQRLTLQSRTWTAGILSAPAVRRSVSG